MVLLMACPKSKSSTMFLKNHFRYILFIILSCLICFPENTLSQNSNLKSLRNLHQPGRTKSQKLNSREKIELSHRVVKMKHGPFILDRAYLPRIRKKEGHILVQLTRPVNATIKHQLKTHGVELLEYLPSNTWKARMPASSLNTVKTLKYVHALGDIYPLDKFPNHVLEKGFHAYTYPGVNTIRVLVTFYRDISFERAKDILAQISGTTDQQGFISGKRILLSIPRDRLQALAGYDEVSWIEGRPLPKKIHNINAAGLSNIDTLQNTPYNLNGSGVIVGEWDAGEVQDDHPDLSGRVILVEAGSIDSHATHVAGTIIANGSGSANAKGMAPSAVLYSYDFEGDVPSELSSAVSLYGLEVSNHSWGYRTGWENNYYDDGMWVWFDDNDFGAYTSKTQAWDQTVYETDIIIVRSAGNDRDEDGDQSQTGHHHYGNSNRIYTDEHPPDGDYDCIDDLGSAKNIITVGAVSDSGSMLDFSSWGPMDDGRIKPDLVANGNALRSTCPTSTYCYKSGTSMSTPVVTGAIALIIEHYFNTFGIAPSSAMVKALLINSAIDKGNIGPDYAYGWGLLDAKAAVDHIDGKTAQVWENNLTTGEILAYTLDITQDIETIKISVVWTDPPGTPGTISALVNDIDLELVDPSAGIHMPWILDPADPAVPATTGINTVDNVEKIVLNEPETGIWMARVIGTSIQGSQSFALVVNVPPVCNLPNIADAYGSTASDPIYNSTCDADDDGDIDGMDIGSYAMTSQ